MDTNKSTKIPAKIFFTTCPATSKIVMLSGIRNKWTDAGDTIAKNWHGVCPDCGKRHKAERIIRRPIEPSNHVCDARCVHAKGERCECACGGENHGIGGLGIVSIGA